MKAKRIVIISLVFVAVAVSYWLSRPAPPKVQTHQVDFGPVESTIANTRSGTVEACRRSKLAPSIGGQIAVIYVAEGQLVDAGALLMELANRELMAATEQAEAALQVQHQQQHSLCIAAESDAKEAKRLAGLLHKELTAENVVDQARAKAEVSQALCLSAKAQELEVAAMLRMQRAMLEKTYIRAPFAGTIADITGEVGEYTTPSPPGVPTPPAIDLLTADCFYVKAPIDEVDAGRLQVGQPVRVLLDAFRGQHFDGVVRRIAPYVEDYAKQARTVSIEVDLNPLNAAEQLLLAGYSADVEVILASHERVLRIPTEALLENNQVWRINEDSIIEAVSVKVGIGNWKYTEITEGLSQGQRILASLGDSQLQPGVRVELDALGPHR